jgi:NRAMP (natural resistance-associated macrophage protein)-like metal ion transporter
MALQIETPDEQIRDVEDELLKPPGTPAPKKKKGFGRFMRIVGPGVITGAADDDPSGIATYTQAGAQFGLQMPWTMLFTYPLMTAVQEACARVGAVTGKGLAAIIRDNYSKKVLFPLVLLVVAANTFNIGSDIGAMAASTQLIIPWLSFPVLAVSFAVIMLLLEIFVPYRLYVRILKWLAVALFSYFITAFMVNVPWMDVLKATITPHIEFNQDFIFMIVAIFGTTISPYLFFWQASNVVEDEISEHRLAQKGGIPKISKRYLRRLRIDTVVGMLFSSVTAWFIIIVGAVVLGAHGIMNVNSAADAAKAIEPLVQGFPNAGYISKLIFATGVIGIGLLSVPVLAGSSSYAISETFNWKEGLFRKFKQAREFYIIIVIGTLVGLAFNFIGLDPIKALIFTAVFNGIAAVPLIFFIAKLSSRQDIMGEYKSRFWSKLGLWTAFVVMGVFAVLLLKSFILP